MPVTATRRNGIGSVQSTVARNTALEKQKKLQDASRNNTVRNIAVGVITVGAIAAAAYLGRGYFSTKLPCQGPQKDPAIFCDAVRAKMSFPSSAAHAAWCAEQIQPKC
jgi:hypothetical protein